VCFELYLKFHKFKQKNNHLIPKSQ